MSKITIIDDSPEDREWLQDLCEGLGHTDVATFGEMAPALDHIAQIPSDVILIDFRLESEMGIVYVGALRSRAPKAHIILVTGQEFPGLGNICSVFGTGFLTKQHLTPEKLRVAIEYA